LNRLPALRQFLRGGEAASYEGVSVRYKHGQQAVMTVYDEIGAVVETVKLHEIGTRQGLHTVMVEHGFQLRPPEEVARIQEEHRVAEAQRIKDLPRQQKIAQAVAIVILLVLISGCVFCCCACWKRRKNKIRSEHVLQNQSQAPEVKAEKVE